MPTTKPIVITSISGTGPMMALDVSTVPEALQLRIVQAAIHACVYIGNGEIEADGECTVADEALDDLVTAVDALDEAARDKCASVSEINGSASIFA